MPYDLIYMWNLKKTKINKQAEQKQIHRYREYFDGCQIGGAWGMGEKGGGIMNYKLVTDGHWDVKCSTGNIVNNAVITVFVWCQVGTRLTWGPLHKLYKCLITGLYT